jgi:hypothetical protein
MADVGPAELTRRALLAGAVTATAVAASAAGADDKVKVERTFTGESKGGKVQEALDKALEQLDKALPEGGVADAQAEWKMSGVTGTRGGIAGVHTVTVTISATRTPEWKKK